MKQATMYVVLQALIIAMVIAIVAEKKNGAELIIGIFPITIYITNMLQRLKRAWVRELVLILFLLLPIVNSIF